MLHCFAQLLQLPPFPLRSLEAALCPGPFPEGTPWQQYKPDWFPPNSQEYSPEDGDEPGKAKPAKAGKAVKAAKQEKEYTTDADGIRRSVRKPEHTKAVKKPLPEDAVVDSEASYASLLLRDVHSALLRAIDGTTPKGDLPDVPRTAQMSVSDSRADQWQDRVYLALLRGHPGLVLPSAVQAALALQLHDYTFLSTDQRIAVLKSWVAASQAICSCWLAAHGLCSKACRQRCATLHSHG
jgi:hypothetical protein